MAKLSGPLLSVSASGQFDKKLLFKTRTSGPQVGQPYRPKKEPSNAQYIQRRIIGYLTAQWQYMSSAQKLPYQTAAHEQHQKGGKPMTGFNYFISVASKDLLTHHGLLGYWPLDENTGATCFDYSGNNRNAILGPDYPTDCPTRQDSFCKEQGKSLYFDGDNDVAADGQCPTLSNGPFTLMAWIKRIVTAENGIAVRVGRLVFSQSIMLGWIKTSYNSKNNSFGAGTYGRYWGTGVDDNKWHLLTVSYPGGNGKNFRMTVDNLSVNYSGYTPNILTGDIKFGEYDVGTPLEFNGWLDEVMLYNRQLSISEIKKHFSLFKNKKVY